MFKATSESLEGVNRRELYKKEKLEETSEVFYCQCGKNYLTFSALYLHARNKHNVKLTTKRSSQNCKIEAKGHQTIVTYFISSPSFEQEVPAPPNQPPQPSIQSPETISRTPQTPIQLIASYLSQARSALQQTDTLVLQKFETYFQILKEAMSSEETLDPTLFFNQFLTFYLPRACLGSPQTPLSLLNQAPSTLLNFNVWLLGKGQTRYQILRTGLPSENLFRYRQ